MNFRNLFLVLILSTVAFSCDDDEEEKAPSIEGEWQGDRADINVTYGFISVYDETDENFEGTLDFEDDGTVTFTRDGQMYTGTYSFDGNKLTTDVDLQLVEGSEPGTTVFDVVELTDTHLQLTLDDDREVTVPDLGLVEVNVKMQLDFTR